MRRPNLARLNHVLIPRTFAARRVQRRRWYGRLAAPLFALYEVLTDEGSAALGLALVAGLVGLDVASTSAHLVWCGLMGLILASLLLRRAYRVDGVTAELTVPARVARGEPMRFGLTLRNQGERAHHALRVRGPFLPWDGRWTGPLPSVPTLASGDRERITLEARFVERGEHHLAPFRVGALVPFGLAMGPTIPTSDARFLVLPAIAAVRHLSLPASRRYQPGGVALASRTGESLEVTGVRPYQRGDPIRDLHARTWARSGTPMVREYQQEYFSRIGVILDTDLDVADEERLEAAISLAAGVVARLTRGEALIDLLVVGDRVHPLTLGRSLGTLDQALDLLAVVEPGRPFAPDGLVRRLAPYLGRLSTVVFVSLAWDEPRRALVRAVTRAGVGCRTLLVAPPGAPVAVGRDVTSVTPDAVRDEVLAL